MNLRLISTGLIFLLCASCVLPEKRIKEASFNDRPAVIKELESRGRLSKESAAAFLSQWKAEALKEQRRQEAFNRWYSSLSPQDQVAYEQSRFQALSAGFQAMTISNAYMNASMQNSMDSALNRQAFDRRTQAIQSPKYYNHNIQGVIYHR